MCDADQTDGWVHAGTEIRIDRGSDSQASCSFIYITVCIDNVYIIIICIYHITLVLSDVSGFVGCMKVFLYLFLYLQDTSTDIYISKPRRYRPARVVCTSRRYRALPAAAFCCRAPNLNGCLAS